MKDRGWPHARSTAGSPDAIIAIGRERGATVPRKAAAGPATATQELPPSARCRAAAAAPPRPLPCPHTHPAPASRRPDTHSRPPSLSAGRSYHPRPQQGGAPQRHHRCSPHPVDWEMTVNAFSRIPELLYPARHVSLLGLQSGD